MIEVTIFVGNTKALTCISIAIQWGYLGAKKNKLWQISGDICKPDAIHTKEIMLEDLMEMAKSECREKLRKCFELLSEKNKLDAIRKIQWHYMTLHNYLVKKFNFNILLYFECLYFQDWSLKLIEKLSQVPSFIRVSDLNVNDEWYILQK